VVGATDRGGAGAERAGRGAGADCDNGRGPPSANVAAAMILMPSINGSFPVGVRLRGTLPREIVNNLFARQVRREFFVFWPPGPGLPVYRTQGEVILLSTEKKKDGRKKQFLETTVFGMSFSHTTRSLARFRNTRKTHAGFITRFRDS
jgi:hypothetical protein